MSPRRRCSSPTHNFPHSRESCCKVIEQELLTLDCKEKPEVDRVEANRMREITTGGDEEKRNGGEELDGDVLDLLTDGIGPVVMAVVVIRRRRRVGEEERVDRVSIVFFVWNSLFLSRLNFATLTKNC